MDDRQLTTLTIKHSHWPINTSLSSPIGGNVQVNDRNILYQNMSDFLSFLNYFLATTDDFRVRECSVCVMM